MKLKKKNILRMFYKAFEEELGPEEAEKRIAVKAVDRLAFRLSEIQDKVVRKQRIDEEIQHIKEICKK